MSILFKGNLEEGNYNLIKTTDGWVLKGKISYAGFNFADQPQGEWIKKLHKVYLPRDYEPDINDYRDYQYNEEDHSIIRYWWHCNQCGYEDVRWSKPIFNFCPNCGARMKGVDDEY